MRGPSPSILGSIEGECSVTNQHVHLTSLCIRPLGCQSPSVGLLRRAIICYPYTVRLAYLSKLIEHTRIPPVIEGRIPLLGAIASSRLAVCGTNQGNHEGLSNMTLLGS